MTVLWRNDEPSPVLASALAGVERSIFFAFDRLLGGVTRLGFLVTAASLLFLLLFFARHRASEQVVSHHAAAIASGLPSGRPPLGQSSIDMAMEYYGIKVPYGVLWPSYDATEEGRGLTRIGLLGIWGSVRVTIGNPAFESWGLLGSTLAHELEVHCRQSFVRIALLDSLGLGGTTLAEREAYRYEMASSVRFGTSKIERHDMRDIMEYYYPRQAHRRRTHFSSLLAHLLKKKSTEQHAAGPRQ